MPHFLQQLRARHPRQRQIRDHRIVILLVQSDQRFISAMSESKPPMIVGAPEQFRPEHLVFPHEHDSRTLHHLLRTLVRNIGTMAPALDGLSEALRSLWYGATYSGKFNSTSPSVFPNTSRKLLRKSAMISRRVSLFVLLLASLFTVETLQAQLTFQPLVVSSNRMQLVLLGNTGSAYAIEKSSNLVNWTTLFSSIASNGRVEFNGPLPSDTAQFFRGRPDATAVNVTPQPNPSQTTQVFATQEGSGTVLEGTNGIRFTLDFPSNNIVTPTTVTMTLVTNMTGLPFAA